MKTSPASDNPSTVNPDPPAPGPPTSGPGAGSTASGSSLTAQSGRPGPKPAPTTTRHKNTGDNHAGPHDGSGRARPLPPDERRAALVAATLPLVTEYGRKVTTRRIAEAAGVAEGTIFRVFPDKDSLIQAAIAAALDPEPSLRELAQVSVALPLRERLVEATTIVQQRLVTVFNLLFALGMHQPPGDQEEHRANIRPVNERIARMILDLLEPDRDEFRCPPEEVSRLLRLLTFTGSHPLITDGNPLTAEEIVSLLLDGVRCHPTGPNLTEHRAFDSGDHRC